MIKDMVRLLEKADLTPVDVVEARKAWKEFREANGFAGNPWLLTDANMKFDKSVAHGVKTFGLSLAHHKTSGYNVCRYATPVCSANCVADSGNGRYNKIKDARVLKTHFLAEHPRAFFTLLCHELDELNKKHPGTAVRLNTFSDVPWERWLEFSRWPNLSLYDYTKWSASVRPEVPGYDLTRSAHERHTNTQIAAMLAAGERVAVCMNIKKKDPAPATYLGFPVVDGDKRDDRFNEPKGVAVMLRPKGSARVGGFARSHVA